MGGPPCLRDDQIGHVPTDDLVANQPEHPLGGRIQLDDPPRSIERDDGVDGRLEIAASSDRPHRFRNTQATGTP